MERFGLYKVRGFIIDGPFREQYNNTESFQVTGVSLVAKGKDEMKVQQDILPYGPLPF